MTAAATRRNAGISGRPPRGDYFANFSSAASNAACTPFTPRGRAAGSFSSIARTGDATVGRRSDGSGGGAVRWAAGEEEVEGAAEGVHVGLRRGLAAELLGGDEPGRADGEADPRPAGAVPPDQSADAQVDDLQPPVVGEE